MTNASEHTFGPIHGHSLTLADMGFDDKTAKAILGSKIALYLLGNGFSQSITDAGALPAEAKYTEADQKELVKHGSREAWQSAKRQARFDAILAGTVGIGGPRGPQVKGLEKFIFEQAVKVLETSVAAHNKAHPTDKKALPNGKGAAEALRGMVEKLKSRPVWPTVVAEATKAYEASQSISSTDLSDLF